MEKPLTEWIEIPVTDMQRAKAFYQKIFSITLNEVDLGALKMAMFPNTVIGGALCYLPNWYVPSENGVIVYLNANPDLRVVEEKIESSGGRIIQPKKMISPDHGFMALFLDTEGNRLALHSLK